MKLISRYGPGGLEIVFTLYDEEEELPGKEPIKGGKPRRYYVYFHRDSDNNIFYVGKGTGRRAWSKERHEVWEKYVNENLDGKYQIEIFRDDLDEEEADELEWVLIDKYEGQLINWQGRAFDYEAIERFHELRDKNRNYVEETRPLEKTNPDEAVNRYRKAMESMREYEAIETEKGLYAEMDLPSGPDWGDYNILDRLTLTLIRLGRLEEAVEEADLYFKDFPSALKLARVKSIVKRVEKARKKLEK